LKALTTQIAATIAEHGSTLRAVDGIGLVIAGRLLGHAPRQQVHQRVGVRELRRRRPRRGRQRAPSQAPTTARR
jgi:hypothetical protein